MPPAPQKDKLVDVAWWTDDASQLMEHLDKNGIRATDQSGQPIVGAMVPESFLAPDSYLLWTNPEDSGLAYEFMEIGAQHREYYSKKADPRLAGGTIPRPAIDPLGIVKTSHHTILTKHPARALRYFTEIFDGTILHEGLNMVLDADSTFIQFTDGVFEIAVPRGSSEYLMFLETEEDHYLGIAFLVSDPSLAASRFDALNVSYEIKDGMVVTEPKSSLGVQWDSQISFPMRKLLRSGWTPRELSQAARCTRTTRS